MGGLVLTGGGTALAGLCDVAEAVFRGCQARKGLAVGILDWPDEIDTAAWTTTAGLAMYSARIKTELGKQSGKLLDRILK